MGLFLWVKRLALTPISVNPHEVGVGTCNFFNFVYTTPHTDMFIKTNLNQRNS